MNRVPHAECLDTVLPLNRCTTAQCVVPHLNFPGLAWTGAGYVAASDLALARRWCRGLSVAS